MTVDASYQKNLIQLLDVGDENKELNFRFIKQRTNKWRMIREKARVTGSTLHAAVGLRGMKRQREHVHHEHFITPHVQAMLDHGTLNEENAVATLVGRFMPIYFPDAYFIEEGCYILPGKEVECLGEVSPDGSIRQVEIDSNGQLIEVQNVLAAVEIKCPFPADEKITVHYKFPEYYVCQCLAEMRVLETDRLIYVSYSAESTTFFQVNFSDELWEAIWNEVVDLYDKERPTLLNKSRPTTRVLKNMIHNFVTTNTMFLGEFASVKMENSGHGQISEKWPLVYALPRQRPQNIVSVNSLIAHVDSAKKILENGYQLQRKRATEGMVWVLTNKDRNSRLEIPCSMPIAYGLKDYRLPATALRDATDEILEVCHQKGFHIRSLSTDGQWIQLMTRDSEHRPLTVFQLQKDVWWEVEKKCQNRN